ncbi:unnamed protein product [Dicrocoelium dendriticum]|nr:unnamed protein product [Dicrocoelium dendriticum]
MECTEPPVECTKKVAEYFLICGLPEKPMSYDLSKVLTHAEEIIIPENTVDFTIFPQPIVDIQLICLKSQGSLPSGYVPIRHSVSGKYKADISRVGDEVYICFRRGRDKPPITNIAMFTDNECHDLRPDAEIIPKTSDGKSANFRNPLTHPTYLSFTRASITSGIDQLAVIDMCIIFPGKHETCPPAFHQLPEALYTNMLGNQAFLCFRKSLIKEHTIAYEPEVLFCYRVPSTIVELESKLNTSSPSDELQTGGSPSPQAPLDPEVCQVAHFCLPWGASIESWSVDQEPPQPNHFSFVLTNESCQRLYGVAFTFHEPYDPSKLDLQMCYLLGVEPDFLFPHSQAVQSESKLNPEEEAKITSRQKHFIRSRIGDRVVGVTKTMCILSRWSFPVAFTNFLAFLYSRCLPGVGNGAIPLERYLAYFLCEIPFPDQNTPNVLVELCAAPILLCLPDEANASSSCEPFFYLLKQLGVDLTINLFVHMLTEQKILLTSVQHFLLTQVGEALTSMIFPLQWTVVYIPFIYMGHVQVIESPSPYLIGVDSRFFDFFRLPTSGSSNGPSVTYVDLDTHNFKPANLSDQPALDSKSLPKKPMKRLRSSLQALYRQIQALCQKQPKWSANFLLKCLVTEPDSSLADTELKWLRTRIPQLFCLLLS